MMVGERCASSNDCWGGKKGRLERWEEGMFIYSWISLKHNGRNIQ